MLPRADKLELIAEATLARPFDDHPFVDLEVQKRVESARLAVGVAVGARGHLASPAIASHPKRGVALIAP
jgi:hypothetical protein